MEKLTGIQIIEILKEKIEEVSSFAYDEIPYTIIEEDEKIQTIKDLWLVENPNPGYNHPTYQEWFNKYQNIPSKYDSAKKRWMQENNIVWEEVEQYGGEGQGDTWYSVKYFPDHNIYLKVDGWYQSYSGTEFNGWDCVKEVKPIQKTVTVYE